MSSRNCNQSLLERWLRVMLGLGLLALIPETNIGYLGFIPLVTGAFGNCPLYTILGISSCREEATSSSK